jgi:hypothetical protein
MPTILLKKSDTPSAVPTTANLTNLAGGAEVAVNTADKRLFTMNSSSAVVELGTNPSSLSIANNASINILTATTATITSLTLSNPLGRAQGGTGLSTAPTNGQLLIGNGAGYTLATLTAGTGLSVTNATGSITIAASGGGLPTVTVTSSTAITAAANFHYVLTAATAATVTLPASPTISDTIYVTVANGLTTNVISRNGKNIQGLAENMTLNAPYASAQLRFTNDATEGWVLA